MGIISGHPRHPADDFDRSKPCRHVIQSTKFREQFDNATAISLLWRACGILPLWKARSDRIKGTRIAR